MIRQTHSMNLFTASGFTLVELMVVVLCMMLVIGPSMRIFHYGTQSSLQGMQQVDTTLEGRRIIRTLHDDLKMSCLDWNAPDPTGAPHQRFLIDDLIEKKGLPPTVSYTFLAFSRSGTVQQNVGSLDDQRLPANRLVSRITYALERPDPNGPMHLYRDELFNPRHPEFARLGGKVNRHLLSKNVNFFQVKPHCIPDPTPGGRDQWVFWVTLQLKEGLQPPPGAGSTVGQMLTERTRGMVIADFYDVVYSEFFHMHAVNDGMLRNWHSEPQAP